MWTWEALWQHFIKRIENTSHVSFCSRWPIKREKEHKRGRRWRFWWKTTCSISWQYLARPSDVKLKTNWSNLTSPTASTVLIRTTCIPRRYLVQLGIRPNMQVGTVRKVCQLFRTKKKLKSKEQHLTLEKQSVNSSLSNRKTKSWKSLQFQDLSRPLSPSLKTFQVFLWYVAEPILFFCHLTLTD